MSRLVVVLVALLLLIGAPALASPSLRLPPGARPCASPCELSLNNPAAPLQVVELHLIGDPGARIRQSPPLPLLWTPKQPLELTLQISGRALLLVRSSGGTWNLLLDLLPDPAPRGLLGPASPIAAENLLPVTVPPDLPPGFHLHELPPQLSAHRATLQAALDLLTATADSCIASRRSGRTEVEGLLLARVVGGLGPQRVFPRLSSLRASAAASASGSSSPSIGKPVENCILEVLSTFQIPTSVRGLYAFEVLYRPPAPLDPPESR